MKSILATTALLFSVMFTTSAQTIVLDPGHGYCKDATKNFNCDNRTDLEIKTNLAVALKLKKIIQDSTKWKIHLTREKDDGWVSLTQRSLKAAEHGADVFLSIHCNAGKGTGTESFWCHLNTAKAEKNEAFAKIVDKKMLEFCGCSSRRVVEDYSYLTTPGGSHFHLGVLKANTVIACLNEIGFVDHPVDMVRLADDMWREKFAMAYYMALKEVVKLK